MVQRKFYHFLHGISDVLEPIRKLHSRSKQRSPHISTNCTASSGGEGEQLNVELLSRRNGSSSDSEAESASSSRSGFEGLQQVSRNHQQQQQQHLHRPPIGGAPTLVSSKDVSPQLKTSIYKRNVMNYLERNLRHRKSMAKSIDDLDDNNNTKEYADDAEDGDAEEERNADADTRGHNEYLDQEMGDEDSVKMKSMPKDEIKIMNFFNSIYNFNQQQHSAHFKPPPTTTTTPPDQFEGNCKGASRRKGGHNLPFNFVCRSTAASTALTNS